MRKDLFYERRIDMMYYLSKVREIHYSDLCERYGISRPTVKRDLDFLYDELSVPLERKRANDGFVRIYGTWRTLTISYINAYMTCGICGATMRIRQELPALIILRKCIRGKIGFIFKLRQGARNIWQKMCNSCTGRGYIFLIMILPERSGHLRMTVRYRCGRCNELPLVWIFLLSADEK